MAVNIVRAIVNGQTVTLTYNSTSGKYEATITAPGTSSYNINSGHYYPVTVKATDEAGNVTTKDDTDSVLGASLQLKVKEKTAPVITIISPTAGAYIVSNKPTIKWKITDDDSGVKTSSLKITVDSTVITDGITTTAISGGYECTYTPSAALSDGSHTIKLDATDNDGNAASQKSVTFKIDTVPPMLSVSKPAAVLITNNKTCTVSGTTNDAISSPVTVKINGQSVMVKDDGSFSTSVTLSEGDNTITVVSTDSAGKSTTVTRKVTLDTAAPTIKNITLTPNPVDAGQTYIISVEVTD